MNDLKKIVLDGATNPAQAAQLVKEHAGLFEGLNEPLSPVTEPITYLNADTNQHETEEEVQDITHEAEDDSLSIVKKEKELIMRALRKNNNKRKYAARDLGISERTLYRKIKEYELEE